MPTRRHPCLTCGAASIRIIYGMPDLDLFERSERGEVALGGCMIFDGRPTRQCSSCGHEFAPAALAQSAR
jgi:hypothetical protein